MKGMILNRSTCTSKSEIIGNLFWLISHIEAQHNNMGDFITITYTVQYQRHWFHNTTIAVLICLKIRSSKTTNKLVIIILHKVLLLHCIELERHNFASFHDQTQEPTQRNTRIESESTFALVLHCDKHQCEGNIIQWGLT